MRWLRVILAVAVAVVVGLSAVTACGDYDDRAPASKAEAQISRTVTRFFRDARSNPEEASKHVEAGRALLPTLRRAAVAQPVEGQVPSRMNVSVWETTFRSATEVSVLLKRREVWALDSTATLRKRQGRWLFDAESVCAFVAHFDHGLEASAPCSAYIPTQRPTTFAAPEVSSLGSGPRDQASAVAQIQRSFHLAFDAGVGNRAAAVEDGEGLMAFLGKRALIESLSARSYAVVPWITHIVFRGATHADVTFRLVPPDSLAPGEGVGRVETGGKAVLQGDRWKLTRETFCSGLGSVGNETDCPRSGPAPTTTTLPVEPMVQLERFPAEAGTLLVLDEKGDVWRANVAGVRRLSDWGPGARGGYPEARFGPDGAVYGQRRHEHALVIDRLVSLGVREPVLTIPERNDPEGAAGYIPGFSATPAGIVLLYFDTKPLTCPAHDDDCRENQGGWVAELRPWDALDRPGRKSVVETVPAGGSQYQLGLEIEGEASNGAWVTIGYYAKGYLRTSLISVPDLREIDCCDVDIPRGVEGALAPSDRSAVAVLDDGRRRNDLIRHPPQLLVLQKGRPARVLYQPDHWSPRSDDASPFSGGLEWGGDFLAVGLNGKLMIFDVERPRRFDTGLSFEGITSMDIFPTRR